MSALSEIQAFVARSLYGMDQRRRDLVEAAWIEDGRFEFHLDGEVVRQAEGRQTIVDRLVSSWEKGSVGTSRHVMTNFWVENPDSDTPTAHYYLVLINGRGQPPKVVSTGVYHDDLVKVDGAWRWKERLLELDGPLG